MSQYHPYQAFGSPMLGSTLVSAPRRQGDGMDSESLLRQAVTSPVSTPSRFPARHTKLTNTQASSTIDVNKHRSKFIPHEPVKGAVKPVLPPAVKPVLPPAISPVLPPAVTNIISNVPREESASRLQKAALDAYSVPGRYRPVKSDSPDPLPIQTDSCISVDLEAADDPVSSLPVSPEVSVTEERRVEGEVISPQHLSNRVTDLQAQLDVQTKVNADLKKLLVASMGDDLHHKVDSLVRTRAQLASEIGGYTDKIHQDYESLDKLTIQADMWCSKYTASRVLVDRLAEEKDTLTERCDDTQRAIQQLLQERQQLKDSLKETHRFLKVVHDAYTPSSTHRPQVIIPNVLELARTNHLLADSIKFRLLPAMPLFASVLDVGVQDNPTPAEKLANQVLCGDQPVDRQGAGLVPRRLSSTLLDKYDRFHPHVRYDNITFNCCAKCRGEIQVV